MSIKGNSKEWLVGKKESNLLSFLGRVKNIQYEDLDQISYSFYIGGDGGHLNFNFKTGENIKFNFPKSENAKILRAISLINENNPQLPILELPQEKQKFYRNTWFIIIMCVFCCFPLGLFLMWRYQKGNTLSRIISTMTVLSLWGFGLYQNHIAYNETKIALNDAYENLSQFQDNLNMQPIATDHIISDVEGSNSIEKEKTQYEIGETAELNGVKITVLDYEESYGNEWANPDNGNVFVFPEIEIINRSDEEIVISSLVSFNCYIDDYKTNISSNAFLAISTEDGKQQLDGSIPTDKKLKGVFGIEAPANWEKIEIYYTDSLWEDSKISFIITK